MTKTMRRLIACGLMILCVHGMPAIAQVSINQWDFLIRAQNSMMTDSIAKIGVRSDATSGFDNIYDVPRPPRSPSGNYLEVYFPHSGGNWPPLLGSKYAVDFQSPADPSWNMNIESSVPGSIIVFWDSSYVQSIPPGVQLFLCDTAAHVRINMRMHGSYTFTYSGKRYFQILGGVEINVKYLMEGFWNGTTQIRDTVTGYLAAQGAPHLSVDSSSVNLADDGTGLLVFPAAPAGDYYLVMFHRNHLTIWSAVTLSVVKSTTVQSTYDFSSGSSSAFGSDPLKQVGSVYVSWGGDVNQDGVIDFLDRNIVANERGQIGYHSSDCNGDGNIDSTDYQIALNNRYRIVQKP